jgi:hypothetical protein
VLVVYLKYSYVIQNLPFFFQKDNSTKDYLNTTVDYRATSTLAYDSTKLDLYLGDEASKWERT